LRQRSYFDQVDTGFLCQMECLPDTRYSKRFAFGSYEPDLGSIYFFVDAVRLLQCDGFTPCLDKN
jgi:hypothetical protein